MKISRNFLIVTSFTLALFMLVTLTISLMPSPQPVQALSGETNLEPTQPPLDADLYIVRAYYDDYQMVHDLSSWTEPWEVYADLGFVVLGVNRADLNLLQVLGFRVEIDEEATLALSEPRTDPPGYAPDYDTIPGYPCYRTVEGTFDTATDIVAAYPSLAQWVDVGDSWEKTIVGGNPGYDMQVLVLTNQNTSGPKPKLMVTSSIHAREYTPAELMTRFAESLVTNYGIDPDVTWILDHHEIHLMLHANPDGRKWAETGLFWRKNTNENYCSPTSSSRGADLNRNFEFQWGCCGGSSNSQCSETYRGSSPASEPEVQAIQQYAQAIFPDQRGPLPTDPAPANATGIYLDIHSYSNLVLWPWGHTFGSPPNGTALQTLGRKFAYFNGYTPYQSPNLYITDGTTIDFGYGDLGVASYVFELGTSFFQTCTFFENTILPGNMPALFYAAKAARTPYLTPQGPDALNLSLSDTSVPQGVPVTLTATFNDTRFNNSQGSEPVDQIAAGAYYLDVPYWITTTIPVTYSMAPADGNFNSSVEGATATIDTSALSVGQHIIFVRGQDNDANAYWGAPSAIFLNIESPLAQETLTKTATVTSTLPGDLFTYTLQYQLDLIGTHTYTLNLRDALPDAITVLTDTIALNNNPAPELYNSNGPAIELFQSGEFTDTHALSLTFQAYADPAPPGTQITNLFTTTLSVDGGAETGQTSNAVVITVEQNGDPWLSLNKSASRTGLAPGEIFTYTLQADLYLTYTHSYTLTLWDLLPADLTVLTDTILLDGVSAPGLYHSATHAISGTLTGVLTDSASILISFQVMASESITHTTLVTNTVSGNAVIGSQPALYGGDATVTVTIIPPELLTNKVYLPLIIR